jgi:hypothetical protein
MPGYLNRLMRALGKSVIALVLVFVAFAGYGFYAEHSAKKRAADMCGSISPGQDASGLLNRAVADGANEVQSRWISVDGIDNLFITYIGLPPFSRHSCRVKATAGRVVSAELSHLD